MNEQRIEELLRKAPRVSTPTGLLEKLNADISLPRAGTKSVKQAESQPFLLRWFPSWSVALFCLACLVGIGAQTNVLSKLKRQNSALHAATQGLDQFRAENQQLKRLQMQSQDLDRLRHDNSDLQRLLQEIGKLRVQLQDWDKLRAENQRLQALSLVASTNMDDESAAKSREEFNNNRCINNLKVIGLSIRLSAEDNDNVYPSDFLSMTNELSTPIHLQCPSDKSRSVKTWSDVAAGNVSYRIISPGFILDKSLKKTFEAPNVVFALCPIHGNLVLTDGGVKKIGANYQSHLKVIDGKTMFGP